MGLIPVHHRSRGLVLLVFAAAFLILLTTPLATPKQLTAKLASLRRQGLQWLATRNERDNTVYPEGAALALVIAARETTETSWVVRKLTDLCLRVMPPRDDSTLNYLRFIARDYAKLPRNMLFLDGSERPWGNDAPDMTALIRRFRVPQGDELVGFSSFALLSSRSVDVSGAAEAQVLRSGVLETAFPFAAGDAEELSYLLNALLDWSSKQLPSTGTASSDSSQFFATAKAVRRKSRSFYKSLLSLVKENDSPAVASFVGDVLLPFVLSGSDLEDFTSADRPKDLASHLCRLVDGCSFNETSQVWSLPTSATIDREYRRRINQGPYYPCQSPAQPEPPEAMIVITGFTGFNPETEAFKSALKDYEIAAAAAKDARAAGQAVDWPASPFDGIVSEDRSGRPYNLSWIIRDIAPRFPIQFVCKTNDDETVPFTVWPNKGFEAPTYLDFIARNYRALPSRIAFLHGHETSWHFNKVKMGQVLANLKWKDVHFADLQHASVICTCLAFNQSVGACKGCSPQGRYVAQAWPTVFEPFESIIGEMPLMLQYFCCGQFVASRERIEALPLEFYEHYLNWTQGLPLPLLADKMAKGFAPVLAKNFTRHQLAILQEHLWLFLLGGDFLPVRPELAQFRKGGGEPYLCSLLSSCQIVKGINNHTRAKETKILLWAEDVTAKLDELNDDGGDETSGGGASGGGNLD